MDKISKNMEENNIKEVKNLKKEIDENVQKEENKKDDKEEKAKQIVHESEITRQHARYKIPAIMEIDGKEYKIDNWSLSGCAIIDLPEEYLNKKFAIGKMIFKFDDFETAIDGLNIEFLRNDKYEDKTIMRCRFTDIKPYQTAILNQIITAYIEGDIITQDDILQVVKRQITYPKKNPKSVDKKKGWSILIIIYFVIFLLVAFLLYVFYTRTFIVKSIIGYVDANVTVIRSPSPSYIEFLKPLHKNEELNVSNPLGAAKLIYGGNVILKNPVKGRIFNIYIHNGEFRNVGEPILSILPDKAGYTIMSHFLAEQAVKLKVGYIATVTLPTGEEFKARIEDIESPEPLKSEKSKPLKNIYARSVNYVNVILKPLNYELTPNLINVSVNVVIDTFRQ